MKKLNLFTLLIFLGTNFLTPLSYAQMENLEDMLKVSREMSLQADSQDGVSGDVDLEDSDSESFADVQNGESDVQDSSSENQEGVENLESFISQNDIRSTEFQVLESESELLDKPSEGLEILVAEAYGITKNPDANISYTLNENEVFTGVGTISISDGETTITILDRNLGATTAGTGCDYKTNGNAYCAYDDTYGYYFQRGNNYGFKPGCDLSGSTYSCADSITLSAVQGQVDANTIEYNPSNQQYYTSGVFYKGNNNWLNDDSKVDLWGGGMTDSTDTTYSLSDDTWKVNPDTVTSRQGPCPEGFHVPSRGELDKLKNLMGNSASDIHTKLLIPFAGGRDYDDASVHRLGYYADLWSSSPYSRSLYLTVNDTLSMDDGYRADADSVRCFYDKYEEYVVPATYTLTFDPQGGSEVDTGIAAENTSRTKPENPSKSGYTFVDWYTSTGYETVFDFTGTLATGNLTVYAKWHDNRCEENEEWYEEIGACATRDTDNIVYYWTGSDGKGLISIVSGDIILTMQDKNLGASVAGTGENSYGELYQRGNNAPITTAPTSTGRVEYENYWPGHSFYDANFRWGKNLYDYWKYNRHYDNLWGGSGDNTAGDWGGINNGDTRQGPCDTGYHVPSIMEWDTVLQIFAFSVGQNLNGGSLHNFGNSTNAGKFKNAFLLSFAGYRYYYDESLKDQGYDGYYWSSSPYGASYSDRSLLLNLNSFNVGATSFYERARGYSIRCFKDSPDAPKTLILTFDANGGVLSGADSEGKLLQKVETGKLAQVPQGISKTGATFQRWSVEGSEDTAFNFSNPITENKILKAIYSCDTGYQEVAGECVEVYTITYHLDGGENNGNNPATYTVESGNILLAQPNKTGYMFLGWTGSNGDEPNTSVKIPAGSTGNRTYNAVWGIFEDLDIYFVSDTGNVVQYTFMDRNLGATTNDIDDEDSYGYYYKWGNNGGFLGYMDDWDDVPTGTWTEGEQGPCPNGYHIPQKDELVGLGFGWTEAMGVATPASEIDVLFQDNDLFDLIKQDFLVSLAGGKASAGGILYGPELYVGWHSSEEYDSGNDYILWFSQQTSEHFFKVGRTNKNSGYPVRCFKDSNEKAIQSVQLDGGTGVIIAVKGGHITRLSEPRKSDYDFDGWYSDSGFSTQVSVGDVPPSILYAKWKPTEYTITYQLNDGAISGENINPEKYTIESGNITLINPVKTGYVFLGWSGTDIDGMTGTVMIPSGSTGDRVYEANWHTDQYTITFDTDKGTSIAPVVLDFGSPVQAPVNPTRNGYRFIGWDPEIPATMPAENLTIKAIWEKLGSSGLGPRGSDKSDTSKEDNTHSSAESPNDIDSQSSIDKDLQGGDNSQKYSPDFQEYIDAYEFAYEKGITTKPTVEAAIMSGNLTRIAMAKMLSQYAINVLGRSPDKTRVNKFNDVSEELDSKYNNGLTLAYQLGIMGQNMRGNNFRPNDEVTRAEFATALSRMLYSTSDGEYKGTNEYYTNHIKLLKEKGIMTKGTPRMKEKRGYVMIMLMRSAK